MFLGWHDPDKKYPTILKVTQAIHRYQAKFEADPETVLCNPAHETELADLSYVVRTVNYIPRDTFYIGIEEPPDS